MATTESSIMAALFARLSALTLSPVMPIAWPNVTYTPPASQKYLRAQFVPNTVERILLGSAGPHHHLGLFQISVYWTKGVGETAPREVAGTIADWFSCDLKLNSGGVVVRITKRPDVRDLMVEDAAVQIPVMIAFEAYA
jgi:hypothetical protein